MKNNLLIVLALLTLLPVAKGGTVVDSATWDVSWDTNIGGTQTSGAASNSAVDPLNLDYYTRTEKLTGVTIKYVAPLSPVSPTITAAFSGVGTYTDAYVKASTNFSSVALFAGLGDTSFNYDVFNPDSGYTKAKSSSTETNFTLAGSESKSFSVARSYSTTILNSTDADVLAFFTQSGTFDISLKSTLEAWYTRTVGTGPVNLAAAGNDSGTVEVIYTYEDAPEPPVIPEPATWAMLVGGIGMLTVGQRFRRRA